MSHAHIVLCLFLFLDVSTFYFRPSMSRRFLYGPSKSSFFELIFSVFYLSALRWFLFIHRRWLRYFLLVRQRQDVLFSYLNADWDILFLLISTLIEMFASFLRQRWHLFFVQTSLSRCLLVVLNYWHIMSVLCCAVMWMLLEICGGDGFTLSGNFNTNQCTLGRVQRYSGFTGWLGKVISMNQSYL